MFAIAAAIGCLADWLSAWFVGCLVDGWLVAWLMVGWLIGCLVDWLLGCLVDWLLGCLVGGVRRWTAGIPSPEERWRRYL